MRRDSSIPTYPLYNIKKGEDLASGASARLAPVRAARLAPVRALLKLYQAFVLELYQATLVIRVYRCSRALTYAGWPTQLMLNHAIKGLSRFWETCSD